MRACVCVYMCVCVCVCVRVAWLSESVWVGESVSEWVGGINDMGGRHGKQIVIVPMCMADNFLIADVSIAGVVTAGLSFCA